MTIYEQFTAMSVEELSRWLDKHGQFDGSPWMLWFEKNYCKKCESIKCSYITAKEKLGIEPFYERSVECTYCELEKKCKFFPDIDDVPDNRDIIEMWLKESITNV